MIDQEKSLLKYNLSLVNKYDNESMLDAVCDSLASNSIIQINAFQTRALVKVQRELWKEGRFFKIWGLPLSSKYLDFRFSI